MVRHEAKRKSGRKTQIIPDTKFPVLRGLLYNLEGLLGERPPSPLNFLDEMKAAELAIAIEAQQEIYEWLGREWNYLKHDEAYIHLRFSYTALGLNVHDVNPRSKESDRYRFLVSLDWPKRTDKKNVQPELVASVADAVAVQYCLRALCAQPAVYLGGAVAMLVGFTDEDAPHNVPCKHTPQKKTEEWRERVAGA